MTRRFALTVLAVALPALGCASTGTAGSASRANNANVVDIHAETLAAGKALLTRSAEYINGGNAPATTLDGDYTITLSTGGQTMSVGQQVTIQLPDKLRQTVKTPVGDRTIVINGSRGMVLAGGRTQPAPESEIAKKVEDLNRELLVIAGRVDDAAAVAAGTDEVDGRACTVVVVTLDGTETVLCVDDNGKIVSQTYPGKHPMQGTPGEIQVVYSDYRDVGGYNLPHKLVMNFDGQEFATVSTNSIAVNTDLDASMFEIAE